MPNSFLRRRARYCSSTCTIAGGLERYRRQPDAVEAATMMVHDDIDGPARARAAFGVQVVFNQLNVVASDRLSA
ncbi:hypothetical protein KCP69_24590 [Salmonella enterica subsp. enterica]|nr:hypothetical protein KCP69_24590 [Salmonella enterica subsp. enterica]